MSELEMPTVITAIANSEAEGFIAGTLFAQGWSVIFRAIDWESLQSFLHDNPEAAQSALLIYGADLPGVEPTKIAGLGVHVRQVIGFSIPGFDSTPLEALHPLPSVAADLISLVRGFIRTPLIRSATLTQRSPRKAKLIAVGSAGSYTGCTMIALNLAMELSLTEKSTLLIEANFRAPSISPLLSMRNIGDKDQWRTIAPNLALAEVRQDWADQIDNFLVRAGSEFDFIIIDIGSISGLSNRLTDRRWTSIMTTWCCDQADELMVTSRADLLGFYRLGQVIELLQQTSVRARLSFTLNMKSTGKRGDSELTRFQALTAPLKPLRVHTINKDPRSLLAAEDEHATLVETNERSNLRKSILALAREIGG